LERPLPLIKVVGISGSGKSTLVRGLRAAGYDARPASQEHSNVPDLWQKFGKPAILIYLNTDVENQTERRPDVTWSNVAHKDEADRLAHARDHADLRIDTNNLEADGVLELALHFLRNQKIRHHPTPLPLQPPTGTARPNQPSPE
jgi:RNase adaptor protein for sRNA GlmZ degradation